MSLTVMYNSGLGLFGLPAALHAVSGRMIKNAVNNILYTSTPTYLLRNQRQDESHLCDTQAASAEASPPLRVCEESVATMIIAGMSLWIPLKKYG
jgi:hypothetical protein